jgi:hypothetical protein
MSNDDLGPIPEPEIEPGEPNPGGVDAIDAEDGEPTIPDFPGGKNPATEEALPDEVIPGGKNPATEEALPDEVKQTEDTSTQATEDENEPMSAEDESPA